MPRPPARRVGAGPSPPVDPRAGLAAASGRSGDDLGGTAGDSMRRTKRVAQMRTFSILHASDLHMGAEPWVLPRGDPTSAGQHLKDVRKRNRWLSWLARFENGARAAAHRFREDVRTLQFWRMTAHDENALVSFAAFAHEMRARRKVDALIITGDLATTGRRTDLQAAYDFLTAPVGQNPFRAGAGLVPYLTAGDRPTLVEWIGPPRGLDILPGNHDRYRPERRGRPGGTIFDEVFTPALWSSQGQVQSGIALKNQDVALHVVKADFALSPGDHGERFSVVGVGVRPFWLGQGRARRRLVTDLLIKTNEIRNALKKKGFIPISLWAIHFDPFTTDRTLRLLESERLIRAAAGANVTAILCGHTHESKIKPLSKATTVYACGTTCQATSPQMDCQLLKIEVDPTKPPWPSITVRVIWYRYDPPPGTGKFQLLSTR